MKRNAPVKINRRKNKLKEAKVNSRKHHKILQKTNK